MSCDAGELYDLLWKQTRLELPGSLDEVLELAFQNTLREFFRDSLTWQEELEVRVFNDRQRYDLNHSVRHAKVQWVSPKGVKYDEKTLAPLTFKSASPEEEPGEPNRYSVEHGSDLLLHPRPSFPAGERHKLFVTVALVPPAGTISREGCGAIPGDLLQTWFDAIHAGVMARMTGQIAKPYTNFAVSKDYWRKFKGKVTEGRDTVARGSTFSPAPWRFPFFSSRGV